MVRFRYQLSGPLSRTRSLITPLCAALFFASGAAALTYEHLYQKLLGRALGASSAGTAAVLVAYMGGLGLGSLAAARWAARTRRPFRAYALVELGAALCALAVPPALAALTRALVEGTSSEAGSAAPVRFLLATLVAAPPAFLGGLTLPLGARMVGADGAAGPIIARRAALLYGANTLGAALGVLTSTYALVPGLGVGGTLRAAAAVNVALALTALLGERLASVATPTALLAEGAPAPAIDHATDSVAVSPPRAAAGALLSGFIGLALEVVWFRLLAVVIGASVFAFGLMLFAFLVGSGVGAALAARGRLGRAGPRALVLLHLAAAAAILAGVPLWDRAPLLFIAVGRLAPGFVLAETTRLAAALALLVPPTLLLGAALPLLFRLARSRGAVASAVGRLYALDTVGAVAGALVATYLLLPRLQSRAALVGLALATAATALLYARRARGLVATGAAVGALTVAAALLPPWDTTRLNSGANAYFAPGFTDIERTLYAAEDPATGLVTVVEKAGTKTLLQNGKFEGNDSFEVRDQYLFSILPLLFVERHETALNIGVGTGATLRAICAFPFRHIEAVDLSARVVDAAERFFPSVNGGALHDPRVRVRVEDGRHHLLATTRRYDLVSIELSSIWLSGTGELYNREFYRLVRERLATGGVLQQWLQLHHITRRDLATVLETVRAELPHVTLWVSGHQGVIVASAAERPLTVDGPTVARWSTTSPERGALLAASGLIHPFAALGHLYLGERDVARLIADVAVEEGVAPEALRSTDDRPVLEYSTPRGNLLPRAYAENLALLERYAMVDLGELLRAPPPLAALAAAYACRERGFLDEARAQLAAAGALADGPEHAALRAALAPSLPGGTGGTRSGGAP
jgi:spermidine synthase